MSDFILDSPTRESAGIPLPDTTQPTSSAAGLCSVYTVMRSCVLVLSGYNRACNEVGDGETVHINGEVITGRNLKGLSTEFLCKAPASGRLSRVEG